ncbi:MAG: ATP synthase F0 subunit B [Peptococcaceae bacterium]|nr:ATP synthase F0 subunit B [Peptococcaceae bacterium]
MENRLIDLIEQLEEILDRGTKVPLTGKIMVDEEVVLEILDGIRSVLPEEIRQANLVLADRDRLMEDARNEGQRIVDRAQKQAEQLIQENEIVAQSRAYAEDIARKAQQYSRDVKLGALKYSDDLLHDVEKKLEETFKAVKSSRDELNVMARWDERIQNNLDD